MELILIALIAQEPVEETSPVPILAQATTTQDSTGGSSTSGQWQYGQVTPPGMKRVYGYRIQVFATIYKDKAEKIRAEVQAQVSYPVYIEEIPPFYKIRIGDFQKREEAEQFLPTVQKSLGYADAFIAETVIFVKEESSGSGGGQ
ncbi:MAG: SPOR domain-containing protein [candidate division WOR-3 bacterium]